jgi:hypothetical protein
LITESFEDAYLNSLSDEILGYANCTSLRLLTHLLTYYAMIAPTELTQNYEHLNTPYDPYQPIEMLFQKIQDARAFAIAGGQPYGAAMIVNVAYTLIFNTVLFPDACRAWQSRAIAGKHGHNSRSISPQPIVNSVSLIRLHSSQVFTAPI